MCLATQLEDARAGLRFALPLKDRLGNEIRKGGRLTEIAVPGHEMRRYQVILRWSPGCVTAECRHDLTLGYTPCPSWPHLCYHALTALLYAFQDKGYTLRFGPREKLEKLHRPLILIQTFQGKGEVWAVTEHIKNGKERTNGHT